ncbi:hypothetical protein RhiirA4_469981 [Rhizophagus irregularis]|uniref:Crinkler effector protein N-terminal domain-containing protein n=1 Tax=Rhizophagus irregularis TaxID=588596 RepID=A0A2I1H0M8_9GLOM|nr:hypothetical protein RhiirA4_469981 [Rhizophagus irregularis]
MSTITLSLGEPYDNTFNVKVNKKDTISELKDAIKEKNTQTFANVKRRTLNKDKKSASNLQSETVEDVTVDVENVEGAESATGHTSQQQFHSYTFLRMKSLFGLKCANCDELPKHILYPGNIINSCIKEDVLGDVVREILRKHTASRIIRSDVNEATNYLWCDINLLWYCKDIS